MRLLALITCAAALPVAAQSVFDILDGVERRYNRPKTIQFHFEQSLAGGGRMTRSESGMVYLSRPGRMKWDYERPAGKFFLVDGKNVYYFSPSARRVERSPVKNSADLRTPLALLMGRLDFRQHFKEFRSRPDGANVAIAALPRSNKAPYDLVEFVVAPDRQIVALKVTGQDKSVMNFVFKDEKSNVPFAPGLFELAVPGGATVVDVN